MATSFHIRPAKPDDANNILKLITDLAVYEKERDAAKNTPELIKENIFKKSYAKALLAFEGDEASPGASIGLALYFYNYSTWTGKPGLYLEDIFVSPERRGLGLAKALFSELGRIAQEKGCARLDWSVLKWNQPSIGFYEKGLSAKRMEDLWVMRLEEEGIERLKNLTSN